MSTLTLTQVGPVAFEVKTDHWSLRIDLPIAKGGTQTGPTPTELTAIALAACKAISVARWSQNKNLDLPKFTAEVTYQMADAPRRIAEMDVQFKDVKAHIPPDLLPRLDAAVEACTVATSFMHPPKISHQLG